MTVRRRFLYLGVFLVAVGGVTLAAQGDIFGSDAAAQALRLWPVALIALGAGLLLHRTRFGLAGGLVAAAMPGLLLGGALVAAQRLVPECGGVAPGSVVSRQGTFDGPATVDLNPDDVRAFPSQALCEMATRRVQWAMPVREQQGLGLMCAPAEDFGQ